MTLAPVFARLQVTTDDIFGEVAKEKEVEAIAVKGKEMKACKSFDTLEIAARASSYPEGTGEIVSQLKEILDASERVALVNKVEQAFAKVASGLLRNATMTGAGMIAYVNNSFGEYVDAKKAEEGEGEPEAPKQKKKKYLKETGLNQKNAVAKMTHLQQHR